MLLSELDLSLISFFFLSILICMDFEFWMLEFGFWILDFLKGIMDFDVKFPVDVD